MSKVDEEVVVREVGRRIAKLRSDQDMSQEELAERLGVARSCLSHWERGVTPPSLRQLVQLCNTFGVDLEMLLLGRPPEVTGTPDLSADQLDRMARHLKGLSEIVTSARKQRWGTKEPQPATRKPDAGPRANSGRGF